MVLRTFQKRRWIFGLSGFNGAGQLLPDLYFAKAEMYSVEMRVWISVPRKGALDLVYSLPHALKRADRVNGVVPF